MTSTDRLSALYDVLTSAGYELDLAAFLQESSLTCTDAWVGDDLTPLAATALSVLLAEVDAWSWAPEEQRRRCSPRVLVTCRMALTVLPAPLDHLHGEYALVTPEGWVNHVRVLDAAEQLREVVAEHDRGDWVEAVRAAGCVADVFDLVVVFMAEWDLVALGKTHDAAGF